MLETLGVVYNGLNHQKDSILYKYRDNHDSASVSLLTEQEEEEEEGEPPTFKEDKILPSYVPHHYFPLFPVMQSTTDKSEPVVSELKQTVSISDKLPLPNIVKKKKKPIDNPFTYLKPFEDSILASIESDQPEGLSVSITQKANINSSENIDSNVHRQKRRRHSEAINQIIDKIEYQNKKALKKEFINDVGVFNEATKQLVVPGDTMFSQESGLLDKLMADITPPIAIANLMAPNLMIDVIVQPGSATPTSALRLNMAKLPSRKQSIGGITIEESPSQTSVNSKTIVSELPSENVSSIEERTNAISLASLSIEPSASSRPAKEKKKPAKLKKKLTISLPKPKADVIPASINSAKATTPPRTASQAPKIRFKIKLPVVTSTTILPASNFTSPKDIINCNCGNPGVDYGTFMVTCDDCGVWYHGSCVGITESGKIEEWHCDRCKIQV